MGIVKISDLMHENVRVASNALSRSINAQAEYWLKLGMLAELYPHLNHQQLVRQLIKSEMNNGTDIESIMADTVPGDMQQEQVS